MNCFLFILVLSSHLCLLNSLQTHLCSMGDESFYLESQLLFDSFLFHIFFMQFYVVL